MDSDDKNTKYGKTLEDSSKATTRRCIFYVLFITLIVDIYVSKAAVLDHLTIWSWILHVLYFELHLPTSPGMVKLLHGPSFTGAHALLLMYIWTMIANPQMEFDLAPPGRPGWVVYGRAIYLHFAPIPLLWNDLYQNRDLLSRLYASNSFLAKGGKLFQFWVCVGGYLAMGLTWEQFNGDAGGTYNVSIVDEETFSSIAKVLAISACIASFLLGLHPVLFKKAED